MAAQSAMVTRELDSTIVKLYRDTGKEFPIAWQAMLAIFIHETEWGSSNLWFNHYNPGGIKYRSDLELGHNYGSVDLNGRYAGRYAHFPSASLGVMAHYRFIMQKRYRKALKVDAMKAVEAIHLAGYAELEEAWLKNVTEYAEYILSLYPSQAYPLTDGGKIVTEDDSDTEEVTTRKPSNLLVNFILSKLDWRTIIDKLWGWLLDRVNEYIDAEIEKRRKEGK